MKIQNKLLLYFFTVSLFNCVSKEKETTTRTSTPKLVIGIVVDQMRYDYLQRFNSKYGEGGFKRLLNQGFSLENAHYNYIPTYTAVGHASIFTGTTPDNHGIIGNYWYDKYLKKSIYCVDDDRHTTVGNDGKGGKKSPYRMFTTTISDQLKLAQNMKGKTIGIGIKDRSAILPAGHTADAAYWFDGGSVGHWISSSFYMNNLPNWVNKFNSLGKADEYLSKPWNTLYDISTYTESIADDNNFEETFKGEEKPVFPHDIPSLRDKNNNYSIIKAIPAGNSITTDFAIAAIEGEKLGQNDYTDFLTLSYSSTDYVGHQFGVDSKEIQDTYLRLDKDLERLFTFLDTNVGKNNYTIFLTADHAAVQVPAYLNSVKIPANYLAGKKLTNFIKTKTKEKFNNDNLIENVSNFQVFLNKEEIKKARLSANGVSNYIVEEVINFDGIYKAVTAKAMQENYFEYGIMSSLQKGYNQKLSGDVLLIPNPSTIIYPKKGSTHGSGYSYDTHIPIIFYGNGIKFGKTAKKYEIIDIAPTIATMLKVEFPNGSTGKVIEEALK
ncbi:alkaline phosphatase [Tenacibaculum sp. SZ-18]|uniref:alkaline phosphatase PafA n=1 Tax=Tenacibaculum sp. SZ-18 TaxID=754423 RepID=UPI000C2CEF65|nr:alkaline phosphatase PafA [Tenacibaculum sp. SZ-18]AUC15670.1 alkaline phosphatase [Tenacibaculum sp. SZ-18]